MTLEGRTILVTGTAQGIEIIAPIPLLVLLGVFLARLHFLGNGFLGNLNKFRTLNLERLFLKTGEERQGR